MREIKFRAWDKKRKRITIPFMLNEINAIEYDGDGFLEGSCFSGVNDSWSQFEIMQFTGLKDKNGKEIYEGDVIKYETSTVYIVVWENAFAGMWLQNKINFDNGPHGIGFESTEQKEIEIIGNIYENESLIK